MVRKGYTENTNQTPGAAGQEDGSSGRSRPVKEPVPEPDMNMEAGPDREIDWSKEADLGLKSRHVGWGNDS